MSSTPSNALRLSSANGAARRIVAKSSSTCHSSMAVMATICCATMSSGLRGYRELSTAPSCIAFATAAQATRSPRNFGKMTPSLTASTLMAAAPDSLQAARDRRRRFDLHDEIDGAHVDAELERRGGHERAQPAGFQQIFDFRALGACDRAVVRANERFARELVEGAGHPLGQAPAVDEDQRGPMLANQLEEARVNRGPDRSGVRRSAPREPSEP